MRLAVVGVREGGEAVLEVIRGKPGGALRAAS
jgi:hypothetical protein